MSLAERLQEVMDEKGFTRYKVAKSLHMSASTISNYLNSKTKPDTTKLEVMSLLLGVNRKWLTTGEGEKYRGKGSVAIENVGADIAVRDDDSLMSRHLAAALDKLTSSMRAKDDDIKRLILINEGLTSKITMLLEKMIEKL